MKQPPQIALAIPADCDYTRGILHGIIRYAAVTRWMLSPVLPGPDGNPTLSRADGIIALPDSPEVLELLKTSKSPCVGVAAADSDLPQALCDDRMIGSLAAGHFLERGIRHFAIVLLADSPESESRRAGFAERLAADSFHKFSVHFIPRNPQPHDLKKLADYLGSLAKPTGLFVATDPLARQVIDLCHQLSIKVPASLAVLGCGNDSVVCELSTPSISSIALPGERVGYAAAELLDQLLSRKKPAEKTIRLPVSSAVARGSTDTVCIRDPHVAEALRFILAHAGEWIGVRELLLAIPIQRRSLERKFRQILGRSPLEEIRRVRVNLACQFLASTDLPMPLVARRAGFSHAKQLSMVFRNELGTTPSAYRTQYRLEEETLEEIPPPSEDAAE